MQKGSSNNIPDEEEQKHAMEAENDLDEEVETDDTEDESEDEEFVSDDDDDLGDLDDEEDEEAKYADNILKDIEKKHDGSSKSRKTIEELLEEKRLKKELDYDFDDFDEDDDD